MTTKEEEFIEYANYHTISDFMNFSIKDVITLQFLARYQKPIVRHLLYNEVKQFIEFKELSPLKEDTSDAPEYKKQFFQFIGETKNLYPPSFYNMLSNLREKGLLKYHENHSGKIPYIQDTPYTNYVPLLLLKFLINNNIMVSEEYRQNFEKKFKEIIKNKTFERVLSIWFSEYVMMPTIELLSEFADEQYILSKNGESDFTADLSVQNIKIAEMISNQISAPEDIFDGVIIPVYKKNPKFYAMNRIQILKEIVRVTKPGGALVCVAIAEEIPESKNVFLNDLITLYNLSLHNRIFSQEELTQDLTKINLREIQIFEYQGLLIGIGRK